MRSLTIASQPAHAQLRNRGSALNREAEDDGGLHHRAAQTRLGLLVGQQLLGLRVHLDRLGDVDGVAGREHERLGPLVLQVGGRRGLDLLVRDLGLAAQVADAEDLFGPTCGLP